MLELNRKNSKVDVDDSPQKMGLDRLDIHSPLHQTSNFWIYNICHFSSAESKNWSNFALLVNLILYLFQCL